MSRSSVDLPQPDGPMSETNSPWRIVRSMPSSAVDGAVAGAEHLADAGDLDDRGRSAAPSAGADAASDRSQHALHGSVAAARQERLGER